MKDILKKHLGSEIGINLQGPTKLMTATLVAVEDSHFTVTHADDKTLYHFPYFAIAVVKENPEGVSYKGSVFHHKMDFKVVIRVGHVVEQVMVT